MTWAVSYRASTARVAKITLVTAFAIALPRSSLAGTCKAEAPLNGCGPCRVEADCGGATGSYFCQAVVPVACGHRASTVVTPTPPPVVGFVWSGGTLAVALWEDGLVRVSHDGGATWDDGAVRANGASRAHILNDGSVALTGDGVSYLSVNRGGSWRSVRYPDGPTAWATADQAVRAVGKALFGTRDGGAHWQPLAALPQTVHGLQYVDPSRILAVMDNGGSDGCGLEACVDPAFRSALSSDAGRSWRVEAAETWATGSWEVGGCESAHVGACFKYSTPCPCRACACGCNGPGAVRYWPPLPYVGAWVEFDLAGLESSNLISVLPGGTRAMVAARARDQGFRFGVLRAVPLVAGCLDRLIDSAFESSWSPVFEDVPDSWVRSREGDATAIAIRALVFAGARDARLVLEGPGGDWMMATTDGGRAWTKLSVMRE